MESLLAKLSAIRHAVAHAFNFAEPGEVLQKAEHAFMEEVTTISTAFDERLKAIEEHLGLGAPIEGEAAGADPDPAGAVVAADTTDLSPAPRTPAVVSAAPADPSPAPATPAVDPLPPADPVPEAATAAADPVPPAEPAEPAVDPIPPATTAAVADPAAASS